MRPDRLFFSSLQQSMGRLGANNVHDNPLKNDEAGVNLHCWPNKKTKVVACSFVRDKYFYASCHPEDNLARFGLARSSVQD
jgi:hypothetical protein